MVIDKGLREKIIEAVGNFPVRVGQTYAEAIADIVLAIPEIKEALAARVELDALKLALLQSQSPSHD